MNSQNGKLTPKLTSAFMKLTVAIVALFLPAFTALGASADLAQPAAKSAPIPMDQLGSVAGEQYQGNGLIVTATPEGARLRCVFQKLEGQATREGLWLTSTAEGSNGERFRVVAVAVGRTEVGADVSPLHSQRPEIRADSRRRLRSDLVLLRTPALTASRLERTHVRCYDFFKMSRPL